MLPYYRIILVYDTLDVVRINNEVDEIVNEYTFIGYTHYERREDAEVVIDYINDKIHEQPTLLERMQRAAGEYEKNNA